MATEIVTTQTTAKADAQTSSGGLQYIRQDLLRVKARQGYIAQQVNTVGAIGGLNKAICDKFSGNAELLQSNSNKVQLGDVLYFSSSQSKVANLVGQVFPGSPVSDVDSFELRRIGLLKALTKVCQLASSEGKSVYVPYMLSCGMAGDKWPVIERLLLECSKLCPVYVCVPIWAESGAEAKGYLGSANSDQLSGSSTSTTAKYKFVPLGSA